MSYQQAKKSRDYCLYPNACGIGSDCSECMGTEIARLNREYDTSVDMLLETETKLNALQAKIDKANEQATIADSWYGRIDENGRCGKAIDAILEALNDD